MRKKFSTTLLLTILVPVIANLLLFVFVLVSFGMARGVAVDLQKRDIGEMVELAGSAVERLWIAPRNHAVTALAGSEVLHRRLAGETSFDELARQWKDARKILEGCFFIYYGLEDGTIEHYPPDPLPEGYDPRERPWYRAGLASHAESGGKPAWTEPYAEIITGEIVVSTVVPLYAGAGESENPAPVGMLSVDVTFEGLRDALGTIHLPAGGSIYLLDASGRPFIGTDDRYAGQNSLPESSDRLLVQSSEPLSNEWKVGVVVPRHALAATFAALQGSIILISAVLLFSAAGIAVLLAGRIASRTRRLARYFDETVEMDAPLSDLFDANDEFSFLNRQFNRAMRSARSAEEEKLARERAFRFLVEEAPAGFFRAHRDGRLLYVNAHFAEMLGYTRSEAEKQIPSLKSLYQDPAEGDLVINDLTRAGQVKNRKIRFVTKSGNPVWMSMTARVTDRSETDRDDYCIEGFLLDITRDMEEFQALASLAETDPLTGAANRRLFDAEGERLARFARERGRSLALAMFDLDDFKRFNDTRGHDAGDLLLQHVVSVARSVTRETDLLARIGGDEFAVLLPDADQEAASGFARRLEHAMETTPPPSFHGMSPNARPDVRPTVSIGTSALSGENVNVSDLLRAADAAMYRAKRARRE